MRWTRLYLMPLLLLAGCNERAPPFAAYRYFRDAVASKSFGLLGFPCDRTKTVNGKEVVAFLPDEKCYKMLPAKRYRGIWLDEFEGSAFFENAASPADVKAKYRQFLNSSYHDNEWLSFSTPVQKSRPRRETPNARMIAIDFIGRRAAYKGSYGHMGVSENMIVVDRVISAKLAYQSENNYLADELKN